MPIGQYDGGNSSIEAPSSSATLACAKLVETSQHMCLVIGTLVSHFTMVRNNNVNQSYFRGCSGMEALSGFLSDVRAVWGLSLLLKLLSDACVLGRDPLMGMHMCVCADSAPQRDTLGWPAYGCQREFPQFWVSWDTRDGLREGSIIHQTDSECRQSKCTCWTLWPWRHHWSCQARMDKRPPQSLLHNGDSALTDNEISAPGTCVSPVFIPWYAHQLSTVSAKSGLAIT